jgi:hypothetical protein
MTEDLNVLIEKIRDENVYAYAKESIDAFNAGAYKGAIVTIWVAIVYDLYRKFNYLSSEHDDKSAEKALAEIESIRNQPNKRKATQWEASILDLALNEVKLISKTEYEHLTRIQKDRHLCAHPVFIEEKLFSPSPELTRCHIKTAMDSLLLKPATTGKALIKALLNDVEDEYFPTSFDDIKERILKRHLKHGDEYIKNIALLSLKSICYLTDFKEKYVQNFTKSLAVIFEEKRNLFYDWELGRKCFAKLIKKRFKYICPLLLKFPDLWELIEEPVKSRLITFLQSQKNLKFYISQVYCHEKYITQVLKKFTDLSHSRRLDLINTIEQAPQNIDAISTLREKLIVQIIQDFCKARSYFSADKQIHYLERFLVYLRFDHLENIIDGICEHQPTVFSRFQVINCAELMEQLFDKLSEHPRAKDAWSKFDKKVAPKRENGNKRFRLDNYDDLDEKIERLINSEISDEEDVEVPS